MDRYHTMKRRFVAALVDWVVFLPVFWFFESFTGGEGSAVIAIIWGVICYLGCSVYFVFMHARYGQTFGKMVSKVVVLDVSECKLPTLHQAIARDSIWILLGGLSYLEVTALVLAGEYERLGGFGTSYGQIIGWLSFAWGWIVIISVAMDPYRRGIHDKMGGTVVVKREYTVRPVV